jgi:hypothetical protein
MASKNTTLDSLKAAASLYGTWKGNATWTLLNPIVADAVASLNAAGMGHEARKLDVATHAVGHMIGTGRSTAKAAMQWREMGLKKQLQTLAAIAGLMGNDECTRSAMDAYTKHFGG